MIPVVALVLDKKFNYPTVMWKKRELDKEV